MHIDAVLKAAKDCGFATLRIVAAGEVPGAEVAARRYFCGNYAIHKVKLSGHFSRARLINYAAFLSRARFIAMLDADILLRREFVHNASYALAEHKRRLILPKVRYLSKFESAAILGNTKARSKTPSHSVMDCKGGLVWMRRKDFISVGGLRCEFEGWGFEEDEFAWRVIRHGFRIHRPECELYHLWHERSKRKAKGYYKKRDENRRIYKRIKSADDFALAFKFEGLEVSNI